MHQPETTPRDSVFYKYKVYPFRRPPEMDGKGKKHKVAIIGAGPIGMVVALQMARYGIPSVIIESEAQVSHGSRAIVLTRRSMEILQQTGVHRPFIEKGLQWQYGRSFFRGTEVYRMVMPHDSDDRYLPGLNIQQQYIEQFLVEAIEATPLIDLRWQTRFDALSQSDTGVTLTLDTPQGPYELQTSWCIAADGGRSAVRKFMNLRMEGNAYPGNFVIADILAPINLPTERLCFFDPDWNPGNNVLVHRQPDGLWRLDFRLPDGETAEQAMEADRLNQRINAILKMIGQPVKWQMDWATVYSANTLTLADYREGRMLFVGDAAHLLPIFGVRGANTGFQDGENLAWKLAFVINGWADESLINSYSFERVTAAREICAEAGRSTRFMSPPSYGYWLMREATLSFSLSENFAKDFMHWRTSRPHDYTKSPINAPADDNATFTGGCENGAAARNIRLGEDDYFLDHLGAGFHLLVFPAGEQLSDGEKTLLKLTEVQGAPVETILIGASDSSASTAIPDPEARIARKYGIESGGVYLLRPDLHISGRWKTASPEKVIAALQQALTPIITETPSC